MPNSEEDDSFCQYLYTQFHTPRISIPGIARNVIVGAPARWPVNFVIRKRNRCLCMYSTHKIRYPQALGHAHSNYPSIHAAKYVVAKDKQGALYPLPKPTTVNR